MHPQVLKLLREELRPALRKCWSTEAARVASAVAASEDDLASIAASSIEFIKGQLVQNGAETAEKLHRRLAGGWRSEEVGGPDAQGKKHAWLFGDGELWQKACESKLDEVRNLVSAFFTEGEQRGSTCVDVIEDKIRTLELELGEIVCIAVADAAQVPLRELTSDQSPPEPPSPQQQAKARVLQRAYRLGAPSQTPQRAAIVRAGLLAALSDCKHKAQRNGASSAALSRVNEALSRWLSAARVFPWIDTAAAKAAKEELGSQLAHARKEEGKAKDIIKKRDARLWDVEQAEERLKQAKAQAAFASREASVHPERKLAASEAVNRLPVWEVRLEEAKKALAMSAKKIAVLPAAVLQALSEQKTQAKVACTVAGQDGTHSSSRVRLQSRNALDVSRTSVDSMRSLLSRLREDLVDVLAGPDKAVEKACVTLQETVHRVMGKAVVTHERVMQPLTAASIALEDTLKHLHKKREKAESKRAFDEEHSKKLQELEKEAKKASAVVRNGEKLGKTLRDSIHMLNADVASAVSLELDAWRRALSAELVPLRGSRREVVSCAMEQLPGTAEGELLKALTHNATAEELLQTRATLRRATALLYTRCVHVLASGRAYFCALCEDAQRSADDVGGVQRLCQWSSRVCSAWPRECWMEDRAEETFAVAQLILQPLPAFQWLGLEEDATPDDVSRAYRSCSRQHHPDKGGSAELLELTQTCAKLLRDAETLKTYLTGRNHEEFIASMQEDLSTRERLKRMQQATERAARGATKPSRGLIEDLSMFPAQMPRISAHASNPTTVQLRWAAKLSGYWLSLGVTFEVGHARSCGRAAPVWTIVYRGPATQAEVSDLRDDDPEYISTQLFRVRAVHESLCSKFSDDTEVQLSLHYSAFWERLAQRKCPQRKAVAKDLATAVLEGLATHRNGPLSELQSL